MPAAHRPHPRPSYTHREDTEDFAELLSHLVNQTVVLHRTRGLSRNDLGCRSKTATTLTQRNAPRRDHFFASRRNRKDTATQTAPSSPPPSLSTRHGSRPHHHRPTQETKPPTTYFVLRERFSSASCNRPEVSWWPASLLTASHLSLVPRQKKNGGWHPTSQQASGRDHLARTPRPPQSKTVAKKSQTFKRDKTAFPFFDLQTNIRAIADKTYASHPSRSTSCGTARPHVASRTLLFSFFLEWHAC